MTIEPGVINDQAVAAGFGDEGHIAAFRLGYAHRGRYGANGENAGLAAGEMPAYMAGINARLTFDAQLAADRQP